MKNIIGTAGYNLIVVVLPCVREKRFNRIVFLLYGDNIKQKAHAWVALRALKIIADSQAKYSKSLVELLSYYLSDVWEGAWLPDTLIRDMAYGHIFKMDSDQQFIEDIKTRNHRRVSYDELKEILKGRRICLEEYLKDFDELNNPYWVIEESGHLPDRVIALNHSIIDMLKMGDFPIAFYLKETSPEVYRKELTKQKIRDLSLSPNFSARQIALTFFIVSHYICDAHMPLHCDLRDQNATLVGGKGKKRRLPNALHPGIEQVWEDSMPNKSYLMIHKYTDDSLEKIITKLPNDSIIEIDTPNSQYKMDTQLFKKMQNEWDEMANICRVSYAVSRKWIPHTFEQIEGLIGKEKCVENGSDLKYEDIVKIIPEKDFKDVTNRIFHDAVESIARLWYRAWFIYCKKSKSQS